MILAKQGQMGIAVLVAVCGWVAGAACGSNDSSGSGGAMQASGASSSGNTCASLGSCGPIHDDCNCGTSCVNNGEGSYECGHSCSTAADCVGVTNPSTGSPKVSCTGPHTGALGIQYDGICY